MESLSSLPWNQCPAPRGISVQLGVEYAADFSNSAAILGQIDLLICVDTAVAHLAAAIGKPCWVLLPHANTDWRWLEDRNDSPWYPGVMRLFRQTPGQDWEHVVSEVAEALKEWFAAPDVIVT